MTALYVLLTVGVIAAVVGLVILWIDGGRSR